MKLNCAPIAATVTGLVFMIGTASLSQSAMAQTAATTSGATQHTQERHPQLRAALRQLKLARTHLLKGAHDFGGERMEALNDTNKAITELEQALKADQQ